MPGCLLLAVRFAVAFWFLAILRRRKLNLDTANQDLEEAGDVLLGPGIDLTHFAAFFLLWMLILPLVVFISETSVSSLWRRKTIISTFLCFGNFIDMLIPGLSSSLLPMDVLVDLLMFL